MAPFVPRGKSEHDFVSNSTVVISDRNVWTCDGGASIHKAGDATNVLNRKASSTGQELNTTGDCTATKVRFLETLKLKLHCDTDVAVHFPRVYVVDSLDTNPLCRPSMPSHYISTGVRLLRGKICSPRGTIA